MIGPVAVSVVAVVAIVVVAGIALGVMRRRIGSGAVGSGRREEMLAALYQARNRLRAPDDTADEDGPE